MQVDNLNTSQLNLSVLAGDVKLKNLRLKKAALDKFNLPVDVVEGFLGDLTLTIPWSNLGGRPVRVLIENVYLLAVPTDSSKSTPEEDAERAYAAKLEKLENAELLSGQSQTDLSAEEHKKNQSFSASLITKIVDNLQIEVRNIHLRYEDNLSVPGHPFACGATLSQFSAVSTNEDWLPAFISKAVNGIHKLAKLGSLAIYFDTDSPSMAGYSTQDAIIKFNDLIAREGKPLPKHQFILKPVSGEGRLVLNKKVDNDTPKTDAELFFDELGFVLDGDQYRDALSMVDLFHFYIRQREYRSFRPPQAEIDQNKNRALWKFATEAVRTEVHDRHRKWSWAYFAERRDDRKAYVRLFKQKAQAPLQVDDNAELVELEKKLGYKDIRFYRSLARSELRKERQATKLDEALHPTQTAASTASSWIGWATGWGHKQSHDPSSDADGGLNEEGRKELYKAIDWDEADAVDHSIDLPPEALLLRLKAKLKTGSLALRTDPHGEKKDLISLNFDDFTLDLGQRPDNFEASVSLGGMRVFDGTCPGTVHPQIVRVKKNFERGSAINLKEIERPATPEADEYEHPVELERAESEASTDSVDDSFFSLKFEHNPLDRRADNALSVRLRHMEVIYHRGYVEAIVRFFKPPESQLESVGALLDVASSTLEGIRKETRAGLEYALAQHKTVDVHLDLNAPIIIVPESVTVKECQHIVLDAGHISVTSEMADQDAVDKVKAKERQEYSDEDFLRLESLMYDKFFVKLEDTQLLIGPSLQACLDALEADDHGHANGGELHILERTSLTFLVQNCIVAQAPNLTRFKVSGALPTLQVNLSDRKYKSLMKMIDVALPKFDDDADTTGASTRPPVAPTGRHTSFAQSRHIDDMGDDEELHGIHLSQDPDADEDAEADDDADGKDEFFEVQDIADTTNIHQKTFEFTFEVERVQASIFRSNPDTTKPDRLLVNAVLQGFQFEFGLRPFDMSVDILLRTLYVEDKTIEDDTEFRHLITSEQLKADEDGEPAQDLVRIHYQGVQKTSPEFQTVHEGFDKTVDVEFSTLNVIITRSSILILFDWVLTTFADGGPPPEPTPEAVNGDDQSVTEVSTDKLRVKVKLTSINLVLNEDGFRLATLSLSAADVTVLLRAPTIHVAARLGNLTFFDDFSADSPREMLSIQGDELADFQYETYDPDNEVAYPGYDTLVKLRSGSLKFTFIEEPVHRILLFFSKFAKMKAVYDAAAASAAQRATEMSDKLPKMHYDILVKTPIVVFPRDEVASDDKIVANLGEIHLKNSFESLDDKLVTNISAGLREVSLSSTVHTASGEAFSLRILDDVEIGVDVKLSQSIDSSAKLNVPTMVVVAKMSDVKMKLPQATYGFVIELLQTIPRAVSFSDEEVGDDVSVDGAAIGTPPRAIEGPATPAKNDGPVVDLGPELAPYAKGPDGEEVQLSLNIEASFAIGTVNLELYTAAAQSEETLKPASLAKFGLNELSVKYKQLSNGAMEAEVLVRSFTVHDTRPERLTRFREIIPATHHKGHQLMVNFTQSGQAKVANVVVDSPKLIFSLDPLFALLDYSTSPFKADPNQPPPPPPDEPEDDAVVPAAPGDPAESFSFRVNVVSPTIILLDDPAKADTEAVILSISQVQMAQQGTLALNVSKVGMFLCRMDKPKENLRVLDNCDINLSLANHPDGPHQVTAIEVGVQPLVLRVSVRDIMLIQSIVNRAVELSNRSAPAEPVEQPARPALTTGKSDTVTRRSRADSNTSRRRRRSSAAGHPPVGPPALISKESLQATFDGFQLVLIGDSHDLPMLDIKAGKFAAKVHDWSTNLDASVTIMPFINYFNLRVSHWEPLMDPWEFSINVSKSVASGLLAVMVSSKKRLELNITSTFIELALTTSAILGREGDKVFTKPRGANAPFVIKNRTGYPLSLWSETADAHGQAHRLEDGDDAPWRFDDWKTIRENISPTSHNALTVMFDGMGWERLRHVFVDREGEHIYPLRPKMNKVTHRLMCEVKLIENVKVVTFRSTFLIENKSLVNAEMVIVDENNKRASPIYKIPPGGECAVPILAAYGSRIKLRPDPGHGYAWSAESLHWQDLVKRPTRAIACKSMTKEAPFRFQAYAVQDKTDPLLRVYPKLTLRLRAPVEVQNLLPHDIRYRVYDKNLEHNWTSFLRAGGVSPIHVAELSHLLLLSVEAQETVFGRSEFAIINTDSPEDLPVENDIVLQDKDKLDLTLRLHYQKHPDSGGAFRVEVYSPYTFINKTGLDFALKSKAWLSAPKNVAGQELFSPDKRRDGTEPFMFSFANDDRRNRVLLRVDDSAWSAPLSFETVGMETEVVLSSSSGLEQLHVGLKVTEGLGDYKLTKVVTLYPRFIISNDTSGVIRFREAGSTKEHAVAAGDRHRLGYIKAGDNPQLVLALPGASSTEWSAPFRIQDIGSNHVRVHNGEHDESLVKVEGLLQGPTIFVRLEQAKGNWPFLLRNDTEFPITFWQSEADEYRAVKGRPRPKRYELKAHSKIPYAWDLPAETNKQLTISINGKERVVNVLEIGAQVPFRFTANGPNGQHARFASIDVRAEGATQAIAFSNYDAEESVFKLQRRNTTTLDRQDSVASSKEAVFEEVKVDVATTFSFGVSFEGVGISLVNKKMRELLYTSFRGLTAKYSDSTTSVSYDLSIKWIQIDNQLFGGLFPILLYPSVIPKDGKELEAHPSLQASVIVLKDEEHGVTYFKYASVLLQEMTIELDEDFLFALLDFAKFEGATGQAEPESRLTDEPAEIPEPKGSSSGGDLYFEVLHLQPLQLDLSFMRTDRINVDQKLNTRNPLFFFINALTMALGNVNDAPVQLNALVIENVRLTLPVLQERLTLHYSQEFVGQLYRVLGSADFLGNPVGLFTNVSSGVSDFFVQPYESVILGGGGDLGVGIARGAGSLAKKTVFGLSDSVAKVTGSIGKGLSAATLDKQYQSQRRMRQFRNKPKHALYGVSAGANSFVTSVASGLEGLATKPLEGAETGGAAGFFKGIGKGLVGAVTKPVVGVFDLANNVTEGIRNTTTVFDQQSLDRVRLPRFTASDGILRPYNPREALGQNWLKNVESGKYFDETYVAHLELAGSDESLVVLVTTQRILLVKTLKLKVGWDVPLSDLATIALEPTGLTLQLRGGVAGPFLAVPDQSARLWLFKHLERVVNAYNARKLAD